MRLTKIFYLLLYYAFCRKLPRSTTPIIGHLCKKARYFCCKKIFLQCGVGVNIERNAYFGNGFEVEIGDFSGIGYECEVPSNLKVGRYVMMAPEVFIAKHNHEFRDVQVPMCLQGVKTAEPVRIEDDVWIGRRVIINPGRCISRGSIVAAGTVLTRDYPHFSIVGGNPSRLIRGRLEISGAG